MINNEGINWSKLDKHNLYALSKWSKHVYFVHTYDSSTWKLKIMNYDLLWLKNKQDWQNHLNFVSISICIYTEQKLSIFIVDIVSKSIGIYRQLKLSIFVIVIVDIVSIWIDKCAKRNLILLKTVSSLSSVLTTYTCTCSHLYHFAIVICHHLTLFTLLFS